MANKNVVLQRHYDEAVPYTGSKCVNTDMFCV